MMFRKMPKVFITTWVILLISISCEKEDNPPSACGVENPHENIEWLKERLELRFCTEVYVYRYNEQDYIGIYDCPVGADYGFVIYNCDGTYFCQYIGFTGECDCDSSFLENAEKTLIFKQFD